MTADAAFLDFFAARGHTVVPSASLHPARQDRALHGRRHGPVQPVLHGRGAAAVPAGGVVQKCVRAGGKHNDLDDIGRTNRHFSFFEMLGNFSFGDYFKAEAIPCAWELYTEVLGARRRPALGDGPRHRRRRRRGSGTRTVGLPVDRIQRLGDETNFWKMADTGPCGYELGDLLGSRSRARSRRRPGRRARTASSRSGTSCSCSSTASPTARRCRSRRRASTPAAGLERNLAVLQGVESVWDIDVFRPLIAAAEAVTGADVRRRSPARRPTSRCASSPSTPAR